MIWRPFEPVLQLHGNCHGEVWIEKRCEETRDRVGNARWNMTDHEEANVYVADRDKKSPLLRGKCINSTVTRGDLAHQLNFDGVLTGKLDNRCSKSTIF